MPVITSVGSILQYSLNLLAGILLSGTQHQCSGIVSISATHFGGFHIGQFRYTVNQIIPFRRHTYERRIARITESVISHFETVSTHFTFCSIVDTEYPTAIIKERKQGIGHHLDGDIRLMNRTANTETMTMMQITAICIFIGSYLVIFRGKIIIYRKFLCQQGIAERIQSQPYLYIFTCHPQVVADGALIPPSIGHSVGTKLIYQTGGSIKHFIHKLEILNSEGTEENTRQLGYSPVGASSTFITEKQIYIEPERIFNLRTFRISQYSGILN